MGCNELKNLFLPSIARTLKKLEALIVDECTKLEEIVAKEQEGQEEEEAAANRIVFPQLKKLNFRYLYNLDGFCRGCFSFEWPSLELVELRKCPKLITFTAAVAIDGTKSTPKQKGSEVEFYPKSSISFAPLELLQNLQELYIKDCEALENIFDLEHKGPLVEKKELLANLKVLQLEDLHELKHLWKGPTSQVILHNLQKVMISGCNKLKILFLPTIARTLEKLKLLLVSGCDELEEIVAKDQEGHEEGEVAIHKIVFPRLKELHLLKLSNLNGFCIGSFPFEWPSLELVEVKWCPKMKSFTAAVPADGIQSTPKLNRIELDGVKIDKLDIHSAIQKHFKEKELYIKELLEKKYLQANLKVLRLEDYHELKHLWKGPTAQVILHNLQEVIISRCYKLKSLFLPTIARTLEKLEYLQVEECDELEEIVAKEQEGHEEGEAAANRIVFPQLKMLYLRFLYNLDGFCRGCFSFEWPSLERVELYRCPKLITFTATVAIDGTQSTLKQKGSEVEFYPKSSISFAPLELLQNLQELSIRYCGALENIFDLEHKGPLVEKKELLANLKVLDLAFLQELKHLWKGPTSQVILHNLQRVIIFECNKLKNLFLPTIARTLEKLEHLLVSGCDELEEIVAKDQEGHEEGEAAIHKIVFPQLKELHLLKLSNLNGFCIGSFPFEWPSLELVEVKWCPKMKTFTTAVPADGIQSTPKLNTIKLDDVEIDVMDINSAIQKHFKEKIASRMEPSDESNEPQSSTQ